jgi:hypothetical protein
MRYYFEAQYIKLAASPHHSAAPYNPLFLISIEFSNQRNSILSGRTYSYLVYPISILSGSGTPLLVFKASLLSSAPSCRKKSLVGFLLGPNDD